MQSFKREGADTLLREMEQLEYNSTIVEKQHILIINPTRLNI